MFVKCIPTSNERISDVPVVEQNVTLSKLDFRTGQKLALQNKTRQIKQFWEQCPPSPYACHKDVGIRLSTCRSLDSEFSR